MYNWVLIFTFCTYPVRPSYDFKVISHAKVYYKTKKQCMAAQNLANLSSWYSDYMVFSECLRSEKDYTVSSSSRNDNYYIWKKRKELNEK